MNVVPTFLGDDGELDAEEKWAGEIGKWDRNNDSMIDEKEVAARSTTQQYETHGTEKCTVLIAAVSIFQLQFFAKRHFLLFIAQGEFQKL